METYKTRCNYLPVQTYDSALERILTIDTMIWDLNLERRTLMDLMESTLKEKFDSYYYTCFLDKTLDDLANDWDITGGCEGAGDDMFENMDLDPDWFSAITDEEKRLLLDQELELYFNQV